MQLIFTSDAITDIDGAPEAVRKSARKATVMFAADPRHPSLQLKKVNKLWSIRLACGWRILMRETQDGYEVLRACDHDEYERLIRTWH